MKNIWVGRGVALLIAGLGMGLMGSLASAKDLALAEIQKPGHILVQSEEVLASKLSEATKGELKVQIKHSGELGGESKTWGMVRDGSVDFARINLGALVNEVSAAKLLSLPYLFKSREQMWKVLAGDFGKRVQSEIEAKGAVVLTYYDSGTRSFYSNKRPIRNRGDFAGLRIRVQDSPVYKDLISLLGGTPQVVSYDKVVDSFKNGEIDAAENNLPSYISSEHYKYAKYLSLDEHSSVPEVLLMSKKAWAGLTPEQQKVVMAAAAESSEYMKRLWAESETTALAKAKKEGVVVTDKSQIGMAGIESFAVKLYSKYVTDLTDLETVLAIGREK